MRRCPPLILVPLLLLLLPACGPQRQCLESHRQTTFVPVFTGKVLIVVPQTRTVCDRHADEGPGGRR